MKTFKLRMILVLLALSMLFCSGWSAKRNVNLNDFLKELSITNTKEQMQSAIWLPLEFYSRLLSSDAKMRKDFAALERYHIFLVRCYDGNEYASWSKIQSRAALQGAASAPVKPLTLVPAKIKPMLDAIKSAVADESVSLNMHFIVFDSNDSDGKPVVETTIKDRIVLTLEKSGSYAKTQFIWHTPFESLIDAGNCPKCGDKIKPYWKLCPWCGGKL